MGDNTNDILMQRQAIRLAAALLAEGLPAESRADFIERSVDRLNARFPAPSRARMRKTLRVIDGQ